MTRYLLPKLIGLALLTMVVLILLSFLEVAIYSYLINPGHDEAFYEAHAFESAPWISAIFGFVIFFLVARYWKRKGYSNLPRLIILFPVVYVLLDIVVITTAGAGQWSSFIWIFLIANGAKFLGSFAGYKWG